MTITVDPTTEAKLRETAEREGRDLDIVANALLVEGLKQQERMLTESANTEDGFDARHGVREKPLENYIAEQRVKRGLPETWPSADAAIEVSPGVFEARS